MSFWSRLFGREAPESDSAASAPNSPLIRRKPLGAPPHFLGDGSYQYEVVGESHYQDELEDLCGGHSDEGHRVESTAYLIPEPSNPYDPQAIRVVIDRKTVAYLPKRETDQFHSAIRGGQATSASCDAIIVGGWMGRRGTGHFGVKLDLVLPLRTA